MNKIHLIFIKKKLKTFYNLLVDLLHIISKNLTHCSKFLHPKVLLNYLLHLLVFLPLRPIKKN